MIVSDSHKFVFIKPQRVAGTSIQKYLVDHETCDFYDEYATPDRGNHETYIEIANKLPNISDYYIFSIVRNPYDRLWSYAKYCVQKAGLYINDYDDSQAFRSKYPSDERYATRMDYMFRVRDSKDDPERLLSMLRIRSFFMQFRERANYRKSKLILDFLIRYETIDSDFAHVCVHLGIPNTGLPKLNFTEPVSYRDVYTKGMRKRIANMYGKDLELFGYTF